MFLNLNRKEVFFQILRRGSVKRGERRMEKKSKADVTIQQEG